MRSWIFLVLLLVARTGVSLAQSPAIVQLAGEASTLRLKTNLYFLASDQLEGRLMASHGDTLASQLVADGFRQAHLLAPYDKGANYFQAMTAIRSDVVKDVFSIDGKSYGRWDGWVFQGQLADVPESPLVFAGGNTLDSFFLALPKQDVGGKAIIVP